MGLKENRDKYRKTAKGVLSQIYNAQKYTSKKRGYPPPNYTLKEFRQWAVLTDFIPLYNRWLSSGYQKDLKPSADRLDDYKPYALNNLRFTTWRDNNNKGNEGRINGSNMKQNRKVYQYTLDGEFVAEYHSQAEAQRQTGILQHNICEAMNGRYKTSGGYKWSGVKL